ncbi:unnamed protein product, partial [Linum tenue]
DTPCYKQSYHIQHKSTNSHFHPSSKEEEARKECYPKQLPYLTKNPGSSSVYD